MSRKEMAQDQDEVKEFVDKLSMPDYVRLILLDPSSQQLEKTLNIC